MINESDNKYKGKRKKVFILLSGIVLVGVIYVSAYCLGKTMIFNKYFNHDLEAKTTKDKNTEVDIENDKKAKLKNVKQVVNKNSNVNKDADDKESLLPLSEAERPLKINVDISKQRVYVYDAQNRLVQDFVCSSGIPGSDTPTGQYRVAERGYSFFSKKYGEGAYFWVQFMGNYLFHSVPFDKNQVIEQSQVAKLGTKASHGCVRLSIDDAKWMYDNIPKDTLVTIKQSY